MGHPPLLQHIQRPKTFTKHYGTQPLPPHIRIRTTIYRILPPEDLWCGDFNRHSPMWDEARNSQLFTRPALREAQRLIDLATTWNMHMALRPGINTLESTSSKNYTRPDNVWVSDSLRETIIKCDV